MKIKVYLKDPDGFYEAVEEAVDKSLPNGLSEGESEALREKRMDETWKKLERWLEYHECVWIEFDTDACTAQVLPMQR